MAEPPADRGHGAAADGQEAMGDEAAKVALRRAMAAARDAGLRPGAGVPRRRSHPRAAPGRGGSPGKDARDPRTLREGVGNFVNERGWREDIAAASVMSRWATLVGERVAEHAKPVSFEDGVLRVRADSTAWATELTHMVPRILRTVETQIGDGVVSSIRVSGPSAPSWKRGPRRSSGPGPRDTYG